MPLKVIWLPSKHLLHFCYPRVQLAAAAVACLLSCSRKAPDNIGTTRTTVSDIGTTRTTVSVPQIGPVQQMLVADGLAFLRSAPAYNLPDHGSVVAVVERRRAQYDLQFSEGVVGMLQLGEKVFLAHEQQTTGGLLVWNDGRFSEEARYQVLPGEVSLGLLARGRDILLVTSERVLTWSSTTRSWRFVRLSRVLTKKRPTGLAVTGSARFAYLGIYQGEFGGGLWRLDIAEGRVEPADACLDASVPCHHALNNRRNPITAVVPDSEHPDCVLATVAIVTFGKGRVLRVCSDRSEVVFERSASDGAQNEPLFGLAPRARGGGYWLLSAHHVSLVRRDFTLVQDWVLSAPQTFGNVDIQSPTEGVLVVNGGPGTDRPAMAVLR